MARRADLHIHTTFSDGRKEPKEIVQIVREKGLTAFAITDHDTLDGYRAVKSLLTEDDAELLVGVELSVIIDGRDIHLLAYDFDPDNENLNKALEKFKQSRNERGREMVEKLQQMGMSITFEAVEQLAAGGVIGRPHVAEALYAGGNLSNYEESFRKYLGNDCPAWVPKASFLPEEAMPMVHHAGGVVVLAHPGIEDAISFTERLVDEGLDGIEVYHPDHKQHQVDRFKSLAEQFRLLITGGSDYHGRSQRHRTIGSQSVPAEVVDKLKNRAQTYRGRC